MLNVSVKATLIIKQNKLIFLIYYRLTLKSDLHVSVLYKIKIFFSFIRWNQRSDL
jgi:hypothetical protein